MQEFLAATLFYCYKLFKDKLLKYQPDLLIVTINSSDITDYIFRGGMERFKSDGSVHFRRGPWWKLIYRYSHFTRWYVHEALKYTSTFVRRKDVERVQNEARNAIVKCLTQLDSICKENVIDFMTVIHISPLEYATISWQDDDIRPVTHMLDSMGIMNVEIHQQLGKYFNKENIGQYSWKIDGHYNSKGYEILAKAVDESIERKYPELLDKLKAERD